MEQDSCIVMVVLEFSSGFDIIKHILEKKKRRFSWDNQCAQQIELKLGYRDAADMKWNAADTRLSELATLSRFQRGH